MKKLLSLCLVFTLCVSLLAGVTVPASAATSGTCGTNLTWTLDDNGTLTISGTGKMTNYSYSSAPWYANRGSIKTVVIKDGVTSIGDYAFYYCGSLTSVTIGDSVTSIGYAAFSWCESLTSITVDAENQYYSSLDGNLYNKNQTTLIQYAIGKTDTSFTIPDSVTSIGEDAFYYCDSLTSVTIPDSVTSIGGSAFSCCYDLTSVTIGDSVTSIGYAAFYACFALTSVTIPDSVTSIGNSAFYYCDSLTSVTIPDSVTSIGYAAFSDCDSLTSVTIGDSVTSIRERAFYSCDSLTSVTIPDSVTSIGYYAFSYCKRLTSVTIPDSVTSIGEWAFSDCDQLTDVYYGGTEEDRDGISIGSDNSPFTNATWHYNYKPLPGVILSTINGAQIRTSGAQGLRFISSIDKTSLDFDRVVEYGTVLIPSADITDISELQIGATLNGHAVAKVKANYMYDETDETVTFTAVITNIAEKNYAREYTARAYAILDNGTVFYADAGASRSIYAVAKRGLDNPTELEVNKEIFRKIVLAVEGTNSGDSGIY